MAKFCALLTSTRHLTTTVQHDNPTTRTGTRARALSTRRRPYFFFARAWGARDGARPARNFRQPSVGNFRASHLAATFEKQLVLHGKQNLTRPHHTPRQGLSAYSRLPTLRKQESEAFLPFLSVWRGGPRFLSSDFLAAPSQKSSVQAAATKLRLKKCGPVGE